MYKALQRNIVFVLGFLLLVACQPTAPTPLPISKFTDPDEELTQAVRQAQDSLYILRQEFLAPRKPYSMISVKVRFESDGEVEDMWTEPVFILDNVYTVRMVEGVTLEQGIHPERLLDVKPQDIVDWMIMEEDGTVHGGYTIRLEYERMTREQQKKFLEVTGYKFD